MALIENDTKYSSMQKKITQQIKKINIQNDPIFVLFPGEAPFQFYFRKNNLNPSLINDWKYKGKSILLVVNHSWGQTFNSVLTGIGKSENDLINTISIFKTDNSELLKIQLK